MKTDVYWIEGNFPGRIALVPRPRGGDWLESEAAAWADAGLDVIVSMLEPAEVEEFGLEYEGNEAAANGIEFVSIPVPDRGVPAADKELISLVETLKEKLSTGKHVGIHCRQSIGRAPLLAAILMTMFGVEPDEAFRRIGKARGRSVPETVEQLDWVKKFAEKHIFAMS